jgi:hypothetical protein
MPRITNKQQFIRYQQLAEVYREAPALLSYLSWRAQVELEQFYQPHKVHTLESLVTHQAEVKKKEPSLPNRAGKHYGQLVEMTDKLRERATNPAPVVTDTAPGKKRKVHTGPHHVTIRSEARQELNVEKVARVLLDFAMQMAKEQRAKDAADSENETPPHAA